MKLNHSEDCRHFFQFLSELDQYPLWCIALSANGDILEVTGLPSNHEGYLQSPQLLSHLFIYIYGLAPPCCQFVVLRIDLHQNTDFEFDLNLIKILRRKRASLKIELCDYVVLTRERIISLLQ